MKINVFNDSDTKSKQMLNNILLELVDNKLTLNEVDYLQRYLSALMLTSPAQTSIISAYNTLENELTSKCKLTEKEKEDFVMCVWSCIYITFEDGTKGIDNLESVEDINFIREEYYEQLFNFKFDQVNEELELPGKFGYDETNPIKVNCIDAIDDYFSRLRTSENNTVVWNRICSYDSDVFYGPTDKYEVIERKFFGKKKKEILYINMYNKKNSITAPEGFILVNEDEE